MASGNRHHSRRAGGRRLLADRDCRHGEHEDRRRAAGHGIDDAQLTMAVRPGKQDEVRQLEGSRPAHERQRPTLHATGQQRRRREKQHSPQKQGQREDRTEEDSEGCRAIASGRFAFTRGVAS